MINITKLKGILLLLLVSSGFLIGCKHDHKPASPELKQAYAIQQKALEIHKAQQPATTNLKQKRAAWLKNMIEIPGMDHDHTNCNHDHSRQTISISDAEMLAVQQAWSDSLTVLIAIDQKNIYE